MITGANISQLQRSPMYKEYMDDVDWAEEGMKTLERETKRMGIDPEQYTMVIRFLSTDAKETLVYHGGPRDADDFERYCKKILNWTDINDDDRNNVKYYVAENIDQAYMMAAGGALIGNTSAIKDVIDVITKGDKKLIDDKYYRENAALVDFNASLFMLQWDNLNQQKEVFKGYIRQVDDDADLLDAVDDLEAWSYAVRWGGNLEIVLKFKFDDEKPVKTLGDFIEKEKDEFFNKLGEAQLKDFMRGEQLDNLRDVEDLSEKARVARAGKVLEIHFAVTWDDLKKFLD
jgi:hypothetical protein